MRPRLRSVLAASVVALHAVPARAAEPEPVHFSYEAQPGCPSEDEFLDAVARDGGLLDRAHRETSARAFTVKLETGEPTVGRLVVTGIDGREAARTIEGERCEDVARSLAVLVALSLDPSPASPPPLSSPRPLLESADPADHRNVDPEPLTERWRVGLSSEGTLSGGASPSLLLGIAIYAELAHGSRSVFSPTLRLGVETTAPGSGTVASESSQLNAPSITFSRRVARADVCPFRFSMRQAWSSDALSADACARLDVGVLEAESSENPGPPHTHYAWVASGALVRIRWVASWLFFDVEGGAMVPLVRERFDFGPAAQVFEVPAVAGVMGIGAGGYFL